jgi:hypothetical protein
MTRRALPQLRDVAIDVLGGLVNGLLIVGTAAQAQRSALTAGEIR